MSTLTKACARVPGAAPQLSQSDEAFYRNLGNGAFRDVTEETGLNKVFMPMGANVLAMWITTDIRTSTWGPEN